MSDNLIVTEIATVYVCATPGALISSERDALDIVGEAMAHNAAWVAIPVARLDPRFFDLSGGLAGAIVQKFVNYQIGLAIVGDISLHIAQSEPLAAFVRESNRGKHIWFLEDEAALRAKFG
ncbi:DUF4180 domain-containing protein [Terricaulis sp.]|uniref:DUF4180 domain-containing protein n=1 Tax=Terricaulis sp. TaxID=2768686 RepID=UPI0037833D5A